MSRRRAVEIPERNMLGLTTSESYTLVIVALAVVIMYLLCKFVFCIIY
jgi:hypothetical protein